jgi:hypothetical protein
MCDAASERVIKNRIYFLLVFRNFSIVPMSKPAKNPADKLSYTGFADTLYAYDSHLERISVFEPEGLKLAY